MRKATGRTKHPARTGEGALFLLTVAFAFLMLLGGEKLIAGESPFSDGGDLLAVLRVENIGRASQLIERLLTEINPHNQFRNPVETAMGNFIRNPGLDNVTKNSYLEILFFNPTKIKGAPFVFAFRVDDGSEYRQTVTAQPSIRQEGISDDVVAMREDIRDTTTALFMTTTAFNTTIFGTGREAIISARSLYEKHGEKGVFPSERGDVRAIVNIKAIASIYRQGIKSSFDQLTEDAMQEIVGASRKDHPFSLGLSTILDQVRNGISNLDTIELSATITDEDVSARAQIAFIRDTTTGRMFAAAREISMPESLAGTMPESAVY
ncbi:MAG: hypothetical protein JXR97_05065, partial [Planctomycetes bacterium]|nr:hypothetical protein [Planctomycetota bacterium]